MIPLPPRSTRTDPLFPDASLCRSPQRVPLGQVDRQPLRERHAGALRVGLALPFGDVRVDALLHFADADPRKLASLAGGDVVSLADQDARHRSARNALENRPGRRRWTHPQSQRRSEEHTSELQSLMRISYAVFCLKKKKQNTM